MGKFVMLRDSAANKLPFLELVNLYLFLFHLTTVLLVRSGNQKRQFICGAVPDSEHHELPCM